MPNILDLQSGSRRQIKKPAPMCLKPLIKLRKIATIPPHRGYRPGPQRSSQPLHRSSHQAHTVFTSSPYPTLQSLHAANIKESLPASQYHLILVRIAAAEPVSIA